MKWSETLRFTGKKSWRWEGVVEWAGENVPVSVWHDSMTGPRAGAAPDAKLLATIEKKLELALKKHWPAKRAASVVMFAGLRAREWKSAPRVTPRSLGIPTLCLPNGVKMPRVDLEFRACGVFGKALFPTMVMEGGTVVGSLQSKFVDGKFVVPWNEQKHSVVPRAVTEDKPALLPPRAKWKPVKKLVWFKEPTVVMAGGWRVKVRGEGQLALAVGTLSDFMRLAAEVLAVTHAEGGWSTKALPAIKLVSKLRPLELSLDGANWTWLFHTGSAFAGHRAEVWADGQTVQAELIG